MGYKLSTSRLDSSRISWIFLWSHKGCVILLHSQATNTPTSSTLRPSRLQPFCLCRHIHNLRVELVDVLVVWEWSRMTTPLHLWSWNTIFFEYLTIEMVQLLFCGLTHSDSEPFNWLSTGALVCCLVHSFNRMLCLPWNVINKYVRYVYLL